jgi:hypothetical protein
MDEVLDMIEDLTDEVINIVETDSKSMRIDLRRLLKQKIHWAIIYTHDMDLELEN